MEAKSVSMTPEFHRGQAERCRRIAAERRDTGSARRLIMQAVNHDRAADILIELNKINARLAVIVGSDELARGVASVRDMDAGAQEEVSLADLEERLAPRA